MDQVLGTFPARENAGMTTDLDRLHALWEASWKGGRRSGRTTLLIHVMASTILLNKTRIAVVLIPEMRDVGYLSEMIVNIFEEYDLFRANATADKIFFLDVQELMHYQIQFRVVGRVNEISYHSIDEDKIFMFDHHGEDGFRYQKLTRVPEPEKPRIRNPYITTRHWLD
jgi:hypothetical protein